MLEQLSGYAVGFALPLILWLLYAAFRWRYLREVRRTTHSPIPGQSLAADGSWKGPTSTTVTIRWIDAESEARKPPPRPLVDARRAAWTMRLALVAAGSVYIVAAAAVVWSGQRAAGFDARAAWFIAYCSSLTGVFLIVAFTGRDWRSWAAAGAGWFGGAFVLLVWPLHLKPLVAIRGIANGMVYATLPLAVVAPLALRITRPLAVGFVPLVGLYVVCATTEAFLFQLFGISFAGLSTLEVVGGSLAALAGIAIAIRQIRRSVGPAFVFSLAAMLILGLSWSFYSRASAIAGAVGGIGANGLLTLLTWQLFSRLLQIKVRAGITDELLHFCLCWLVLTALLPAMANTGWRSVPLVVALFVAFMATLFLLLRRQGRRRAPGPPPRMLLLRAFAEEPLRNRLIDVLDDSWRRVGCIDLIVGNDLAIRSLSPIALEGFLLGRVHRQVLTTVEDAAQRLAVAPLERAVDGRYLLNEFHCSPDVWTHVVTMLARRADVVLIDLGGWNASHRGVTVELSLAMDRVPLSRIVLLADQLTDERGLTIAIERTWAQLPGESVNARLPEASIEVIRCSGQRRTDAAAIANRVFGVTLSLLTQGPVPAVSS